MVKELLSERPDLVAQFVLFCPIEKVDAGSCLPPLSTASVVNNDPVAFPINTTQAGFLQYSHAIDFVTAVKNAYAARPHVYLMFLKIIQEYQRDRSCNPVFLFNPANYGDPRAA